jgi:hypothetical protein
VENAGRFDFNRAFIEAELEVVPAGRMYFHAFKFPNISILPFAVIVGY